MNAPDWTEAERFDINAKFPEGVQRTPGVQDAMLQEQLGLKLESTRVPVEVFVFDTVNPSTHLSREPAA